MSKLDELKAVQKKTGQSWTPPPREAVKIEPIEAGSLDRASPAPEQPAAMPQPKSAPTPPANASVRNLASVTPVDPRTLPIDTTARLMPVGTHIYPDRHNQVRHEAFALGIKPWEVFEAALAEYFERRYGGSSSANMK
jgi:hypothetical protein